MSDQALKDAKLASLESENTHLNRVVQSLTNQVRSRQIQAQEQFEQNANFRTTIILFETEMNKLQESNASLNERIIALEKEKADLNEVVVALEKEKADLAAKLNGTYDADKAA